MIRYLGCIYILITIIHKQIMCTSPPAYYYQHPTIMLTSKITILQVVNQNNYDITNVDNMKINDFYVVRKSILGKLEIFDLNTSTLKYSLYYNTSYEGNSKVIAYDVPDHDKTRLTVILDNNLCHIHQLNDDGSFSSIQNFQSNVGGGLQAVQYIKDQILILGLDNYAIIYRFKDATHYHQTQRMITQLNKVIFNLKTCMANQNDQSYLVAAWKANCYVEVYLCEFIGSCSLIYNFNSTNCLESELSSTIKTRYKLNFNFDCTRIIFEQKSVGIRTINLETITEQSAYPSSFTMTPEIFSQLTFLDQYNLFVGATTITGIIKIFNNQVSASLIESEHFPNYGYSCAYNYRNKVFALGDNSALYLYKMGCSNSSLTLSEQGVCSEDLFSVGIVNTNMSASNSSNTSNPSNPSNNSSSNSTLSITNSNNTVNITTSNTISIISITNTTTINNTVTDSSGNIATINSNSSNSSSANSIENNINQTSLKVTLPAVQPKYQYEAQIGDAAQQSFTVLGTSTSYAISFLQFFPFSFLFIRFINFWSICSIYLLLGISFPTYLRDILLTIYNDINITLFSSFNFKLQVSTPIKEKFNGQLSDVFGLSSDAINSNIQTFSIVMLSYFILGFFYLLSRKLPQNNFLGKKLADINYPMAALAQYVSIMNTFYFNLPTITDNSYQSEFIEKINLILQHFLFVFSSFVPCLALILLDKVFKKKSENKENQREKLTWFIDCMCNVLIPFTVILKNLLLFFVINLIFFCLPIYAATKQLEFKLNYIVLSFYIPLFHLGIIGLTIFDEASFPGVYHNLALLATIVLFLGAAHQTLTLFCSAIYDLVITIKRKCNSISNSSEISQFKVNFTENNFKKAHIQQIKNNTNTKYCQSSYLHTDSTMQNNFPPQKIHGKHIYAHKYKILKIRAKQQKIDINKRLVVKFKKRKNETKQTVFKVQSVQNVQNVQNVQSVENIEDIQKVQL